jgi:D-tagatose-1,6-bisphosphate aldolase subunit GatZ/KbaZ
MKSYRLGFGPMSIDIIDMLCEYSILHDIPLMIIASRNQIDWANGYVCRTDELVKQVKNHNANVLLCRDHCGPYFSDKDAGLDIDSAIARCKKTIETDISQGFDLIHIDVSRIPHSQLYYAEQLIEHCLSIKPDIKLEFGSEDNTGTNILDSIDRIDEQLDFLNKYKNNVVFFVTQTGSYVKDRQIGSFNLENNKAIVDKIHSSGFLFKEHNADYLNNDDLLLRIAAGIDSLNIAPQLGRIQTDLLTELCDKDTIYQDFCDYVYGKNSWNRWVSQDVVSKELAVSVGGHYCFDSIYYKKIIENIGADKFRQALKNKIFDVLDVYKTFDDGKL